MAGEWLLATQFAAAILMLLLAGWLCYLDFRSRAVRAFAAFLVLRAVLNLTLRFADVSDGTLDDLVNRVAPYYELAVPFALVYFLSVYPRPRGLGRVAWGLPLLLAAGLVVELAYALDHSLFRRADSPIEFVRGILPLASAVGAYVLTRDAIAAGPGRARASHTLIAAGLAADVAVIGGVLLPTLDQRPQTLSVLLPVLSLAVVAASLTKFGRASRADPTLAAAAASTTVVVVGAFALGLGSGSVAAGDLADETLSNVAVGTIGVARLALPILAAVALARYKLFDLDVRVKWTVGKTLVGSIVGSIFFIVSELVESQLGASAGTLSGIAAAGILLLAFTPIQHLAEKLAARAYPVQEMAVLTREARLKIYREVADESWRDGVIDKKEREFLDRLRERLDLDINETSRLESEISLQVARR